MNARRGVLACGLLALLVTSRIANADPFFEVARPETAPPGLPVGLAAPAFALIDQDGKTVTLQSLLGRGPVAVVFFRSADWCGYCKLQLVQLEQHRPEIEVAGAQLVGISFDKPEILHRFADQRIHFPLLSDAGSQTIEAYGIGNPDAASWSRGVARHGTFILDREGTIRSKLYQVSYAERAAVDELLAALRVAAEPRK